MNCQRFPTGQTLEAASSFMCHRYVRFGHHRAGLWGEDTVPFKRHREPPAATTATPRSSLSVCVSDSRSPCATLIGSTRMADGDKTGLLLFAAGACALPALLCCHSARQDDDAIESRPLITTMQYTVGQLIRISPSVYLFVDIFKMPVILKVQGDIWGAHFNMSIPITLPWQPWDRLALWAARQSSLLPLYRIFSQRDSAFMCSWCLGLILVENLHSKKRWFFKCSLNV